MRTITKDNDNLSRVIDTWFGRTIGIESSRLDERNGLFSIATDKGTTRKINEDFAAVAALWSDKSSKPLLLGIVADGVGGLSKGDHAARLGIASFLSALVNSVGSTAKSLEEQVSSALVSANRKVYNEFKEKSGTTIAGVATNLTDTAVFSVGDSLVYFLDANRKMTRVNDLDTLEDAISLKQSGTVLSSSLLQFIGMSSDVEPNVFSQKNSPRAAILCSDGTNQMTKQQFDNLVQSAGSMSEISRRSVLVSNWIGGKDNATSVAIKLDRESIQKNLHSPFNYALRIWDVEGELTLRYRGISEDAEQARSTREKKANSAKSKTRKTKVDKKVEEVCQDERQEELFDETKLDDAKLDVTFEIKDD